MRLTFSESNLRISNALRPNFGLGMLPTHVDRFPAKWHRHLYETRGWVMCAGALGNGASVYGVSVR